jgi:hypothetical protein
MMPSRKLTAFFAKSCTSQLKETAAASALPKDDLTAESQLASVEVHSTLHSLDSTLHSLASSPGRHRAEAVSNKRKRYLQKCGCLEAPLWVEGTFPEAGIYIGARSVHAWRTKRVRP